MYTNPPHKKNPSQIKFVSIYSPFGQRNKWFKQKSQPCQADPPLENIIEKTASAKIYKCMAGKDL